MEVNLETDLTENVGSWVELRNINQVKIHTLISRVRRLFVLSDYNITALTTQFHF